MDLAKLRVEYVTEPVDVESFDPDPLVQLQVWMSHAIDNAVTEPNAMVVATVDEQHQPFSRNVLLKEITASGLVFCTNFRSDKAKHIASNNKVSLTFSWLEIHRQIHVQGVVTDAPVEMSDKIWEHRSRLAQAASKSSDQSSEIESREAIMEAFQHQLDTDGAIDRPEWWGAKVVDPHRFEFWQGAESRLHDRIIYERCVELDASSHPELDSGSETGWAKKRLWP